MCKYLALWLFISFILTPAHAASWHYDYVGRSGGSAIGITLTRDDFEDGTLFEGDEIRAASYFYHHDLRDRALKLESLEGRFLRLGAYSNDGVLLGRFELQFAARDPEERFVSEADLVNEVLIGRWVPFDKERTETIGKEYKREKQVYLTLAHTVTGSADGARCGLSAAAYKAVETRIARFRNAALNNEIVIIRDEFGYRKPISVEEKTALKAAVPHNLFCNWRGIMLGHGVFWFDHDGNVL